MTKHYLIWFVLFFLLFCDIRVTTGQNSEDLGVNQKHQIGFHATDTFRFIRQESDKKYKINYRYMMNPTTALRSGFNYRLNTGGTGSLQFDVRAGMDKEFKRSNRWRFYAGGDLLGGVEKMSGSSRRNYHAGLAPILGILFFVDDHFSISTEPGLLMELRYYKDENTFNPSNSKTWLEMSIINVGQFILSFHF